MLRALSLVILLLLVPQVRCDDLAKEKKGPPANELLSEGLAKAKKDEKRLFLVFGSPTCIWCKYLEKYHGDEQVKKVVDKYFVIVKVDIVANPGGEELYKKYGSDRGVPAWTVLAPDLKVVSDSGDGKDNVGFPYEKKEVEHYIKAMRTAAPKMTDIEAELLAKKLLEVGPKTEKKDQ